MIADRKHINTHLLYLVIDSVRNRLSHGIDRTCLDLDGDVANALVFTTDNSYYYWFYDITVTGGIYLHQTTTTKNNLDLVFESERNFARIDSLVEHIATTINNIEG